MIVLAGIPSEPPLAMVAAALDDLGETYCFWNQRRSLAMALDYEVREGAVAGVWHNDGRDIDLGSVRGVYVRLVDEAVTPELRDLPPAAAERRHARALHEGFGLWLELTAARVANRPSANGSNGSKPWQAQAIVAQGLRTPPTLVTNSPAAVADFESRSGTLIYKSASGQRSVVRQLDDTARQRLGLLKHCPVQFQRQVPGDDLRVHVVGGRCFATRIRSRATDYRYAAQDGAEVTLEPAALEAPLEAACLRLSRALDLPFAGIDLRIGPQGHVWCFEVNPCPGFSYYEQHTGQPIARALAAWLAGNERAG